MCIRDRLRVHPFNERDLPLIACLFERVGCRPLIERVDECESLMKIELIDYLSDIRGVELRYVVLRDGQLHAHRITSYRVDVCPSDIILFGMNPHALYHALDSKSSQKPRSADIYADKPVRAIRAGKL